MSNELATQGGYLAMSDADYLNEFEKEAHGLKGGGSFAFMKMDGNTGDFSYGADDVELPPGTQLVMDYRSYKRGWLIWVGGKPEHEVMVGIEEGTKPPKTSLPNLGPYAKGDGPKEQITVNFKMVEEPFVEMVFQANNASKLNAMGALLKDFAGNFRAHPNCMPIVEIDSVAFDAKDPDAPGRKFKKYAPVFKIVAWATQEQLAALVEGNPDDYATDEEIEEEVEADEPAPEPVKPAKVAKPAAQKALAAPAQAAKPAATVAAKAAAPAAAAPAAGRRARF